MRPGLLRGSGVKWDIRKVQPYEAKDKVEFEVPTSAQAIL